MLKKLIDGKRVALIGPSPHLKNSNNGSFIDSFDTVIRINELGVSDSLIDDYGSKTNVAFLTLTEQSVPVYKEMIKELDLNSLNLVVHPRDKLNFNPYEKTYSKKSSFEYFNELNLDIDLYQVEKPSFEERCEYFSCFPTTGGLAIYEILQHDFAELYISGFSFYTTKYKYNTPRIIFEQQNPFVDQKHNIRKSGHNTDKEVKIINQLLSLNSSKNITYDRLFKKIILNKYHYYQARKFLIHKVNLDNIKNEIKLLIRRFKSKFS